MTTDRDMKIAEAAVKLACRYESGVEYTMSADLKEKIAAILAAIPPEPVSVPDVNAVYAQRNELAVAFCKAAVAAGWTAGRGYDDDHKKAWEPDWRHVVYVDLPNGKQVSWHMSPDCIHLLDDLPKYPHAWDGTFHGRKFGWSAMLSAPQPEPVSVPEYGVKQADADICGIWDVFSKNGWFMTVTAPLGYDAKSVKDSMVSQGYADHLQVSARHCVAARDNPVAALTGEVEKLRAMLAAAPQPGQPAPVAAKHIGYDYLDNGQLVATYALPVQSAAGDAPALYAAIEARLKGGA